MIVFRHSGLKCLTKVSQMGIPCGYVGLPKSHPDFGKNYDDVDVEVHGGLTFSNYWQDLEDGLWYLGFDCGHSWDVELPRSVSSYPYTFKSNKSEDYVEEQTKRLAEQLAARQMK